MKIQWTTRHTVVTVLAILTATLYALAATGTVHTDLVSNGKIEALCIGFGAGLFTPGSPLGLVLSKLFPPAGTPSVMPTLADLQAIAADAQTQGATLAINLHIDTDAATTTPVERPVRVPPSRTSGGAAVDVLRDIVGVFAFATAAALLCHGCGASGLQVSAASTVVAMRAVHVTEDAYLADLAHARDACADDACITQNRANHHAAEVVVDALRTAVLAWIDAVGVALSAEDETATLNETLTLLAQDVVERALDVVHELMDAGVVIPAELAALIPGAS